jgi:hypothetical protein
MVNFEQARNISEIKSFYEKAEIPVDFTNAQIIGTRKSNHPHL